jgi:hypothetical protein
MDHIEYDRESLGEDPVGRRRRFLGRETGEGNRRGVVSRTTTSV